MLQDEIAQKESIIKSISDNRWLISPESIRTYRSIAEKLRVPYAFDYLSEGESVGYNATASVFAQSCSDGLDQSKIDSFVKTLDQDTYLVYMEGQ